MRVTGANAATGSTARDPYVSGSSVMSTPDTSSVYPSGAALATASLAALPATPGRFSTITGCPSESARRPPTSRAKTSSWLPGAKGTIRWIGRFG